ncbi:MAG: VOC family protein [Bacteroidota bacterium]
MEFNTLTPNLMVANVDASVAYYQQLLGAEQVSSVPGPEGTGLQWAMVRIGKLELMFQTEKSLKEDVPAIPAAVKPGAANTIFIRMKGVEALYKKARTQATILAHLETRFYGMKEFTMQDPDGYMFTFAEPVQATPPSSGQVA